MVCNYSLKGDDMKIGTTFMAQRRAAAGKQSDGKALDAGVREGIERPKATR